MKCSVENRSVVVAHSSVGSVVGSVSIPHEVELVSVPKARYKVTST